MRTVAGEIDLRWRILELAATDAALERQLVLLGGVADPVDHPGRNVLQDWLGSRYDAHFETAKAVSWFVTSDRGIQLARAGVGVPGELREIQKYS